MSLFFPRKPDWGQDYVFDYWQDETHQFIPYDFSKILPSDGVADFLHHVCFMVSVGGWFAMFLSGYRMIIDLIHNNTYENTLVYWAPLKGWDLSKEIMYLSCRKEIAGLGWMRIYSPTLSDKARRLANTSLSVVTGKNEWVGNSLLIKDRYTEVSTTAVEKAKVDLGSLLSITKLAILYQAEKVYGTVGWSLEYSPDDVNWTVIKSGTSAEMFVVYVENISARYVRLTLAGDGTNSSIFNLFKLWTWA